MVSSTFSPFFRASLARFLASMRSWRSRSARSLASAWQLFGYFLGVVDLIEYKGLDTAEHIGKGPVDTYADGHHEGEPNGDEGHDIHHHLHAGAGLTHIGAVLHGNDGRKQRGKTGEQRDDDQPVPAALPGHIGGAGKIHTKEAHIKGLDLGDDIGADAGISGGILHDALVNADLGGVAGGGDAQGARDLGKGGDGFLEKRSRRVRGLYTTSNRPKMTGN